MAIKYGTNTSDNLYGTEGADSLFGWDVGNAPDDTGPATDNDRLYSNGRDLLGGGGGDDTLYGGYGDETLLGGSGTDLLISAGSPEIASTFEGGSGIDTFMSIAGSLDAQNFSVLSMTAGLTLTDGTVLRGIEAVHFRGSAFADSIGGGYHDDTLLGDRGADVLGGNLGNDLLNGGRGADTVYGGDGDDTLMAAAKAGADVLRGGSGIDVLAYDGAPGRARDVTMVLGYTVTLQNGTTATGFERLDYTGTAAADIITGGNWDDTLYGGAGGADVLTGRAGDDLLLVDSGNFGNITLSGGAGDDTLGGIAVLDTGTLISGGDGTDTLLVDLHLFDGGIALFAADLLSGAGSTIGTGSIRGIEQFHMIGGDGGDRFIGGTGDDTLMGKGGADSLLGGAGDDLIDGGLGNDTLLGGDGDDMLTETQGSNIMFGAAGDDVLAVGAGAAQAQFLYGGTGDDSLTGGLGGDVLNGGAGSDVLTGYLGADAFTFNTVGPVDSITDFVSGTDSIVLKVSAFTGLIAGDLAAADFVLGTAATDASDRIVYDAATGALWHDADGLGGAAAQQFAALVAGTAVTADDFLLS